MGMCMAPAYIVCMDNTGVHAYGDIYVDVT